MRRRTPIAFSSLRMIIEHKSLRERLKHWQEILSDQYETEMFYTTNRVPPFVAQPPKDDFFTRDGTGQIRSATVEALYLACYPSAVDEPFRSRWTCLQTTIPTTNDDEVWETLKRAASCFGVMGGAYFDNAEFVRYVQNIKAQQVAGESGQPGSNLPNLISGMTPVPAFVGSHTWVPAEVVEDVGDLQQGFEMIERVEGTVLLRVSSEPFQMATDAPRLARAETRFAAVQQRSDKIF